MLSVNGSPSHLFENAILEVNVFVRKSCSLGVRPLEKLGAVSKITSEEKEVVGLAFGSCVCRHFTKKLF